MKKLIFKTISCALIIAVTVNSLGDYVYSAQRHSLRPVSTVITDLATAGPVSTELSGKASSSGVNEERPLNEQGLRLEWPIILMGPVLACMFLMPFFMVGLLPVYMAHLYIFFGLAVSTFSVWVHERAHAKFGGRIHLDRQGVFSEAVSDKNLLPQQAKAGMLQNAKWAKTFTTLSVAFFLPAIFYGFCLLFLPHIATLMPVLFIKPTAWIAALASIGAIVNITYWFGSAFFGRDGLAARATSFEAAQPDYLDELKHCFRGDRGFIDALDRALNDEEMAHELIARFERNEPIWRYGAAIRYDSEQNRFVNDTARFRPELFDEPLFIGIESSEMSQYHYIDCDSVLAEGFDPGEIIRERMRIRQERDSFFYIYKMEPLKKNSSESVPYVCGLIRVMEGSANVDGFSCPQGSAVLSIISRDGGTFDKPVRVDEVFDMKNEYVVIPRVNTNENTLECLYDYSKVAEDADYLVLRKENRSRFPFTRDKYDAFVNIVKSSRIYKWAVIPEFFSVAVAGILTAVLLPSILAMAQGFGVLAIALIVIMFVNQITIVVGHSVANNRIGGMEALLAKIRFLKSRGKGLGDAIRQEVDMRIVRWHGAWWPISIVMQRALFLLMYPIFFIMLGPSSPFMMRALFLAIYVLWNILGNMIQPSEMQNMYFISEKGASRGYFEDMRKEGLTERFWRAQTFRGNLNQIIMLVALLSTIAIMKIVPTVALVITETITVSVISSPLFWWIFIPVTLLLRPLLRCLILLYGEDSDSKLIIYSDLDDEQITEYTRGGYRNKYRFNDCGITIRSDNPYFRPERMRDYRLKNLYGIPLRLAETLESIPVIGALPLSRMVQWNVWFNPFRDEEAYIIVNPDRVGIEIIPDSSVDLADWLKGRSHSTVKSVRYSWRLGQKGRCVAEIRQYINGEHIRLNAGNGFIAVGSKKSEDEKIKHAENIDKFVEDTFKKSEGRSPLLPEEESRIKRTLLNGGVVYIHQIPYVYESWVGRVTSNTDEYREDLHDDRYGRIYAANMPLQGLRQYNFYQEPGEDSLSVYHYVRPGPDPVNPLPDEYAEGQKVLDGKVKVSDEWRRFPGVLGLFKRRMHTVTIEKDGDLEAALPVERLIRRNHIDRILIEKNLAADGIEEALPGFALDNQGGGSKYDIYVKQGYSVLDRIMLWREAQRADDQRSRNLKYGEWGHMLRNLALGILIPTVYLVFSKMGEMNFEKLDVSVFYQNPLLVFTSLIFLAAISERVDKISKMENSQSARQASKNDLGIDRKYEAFNQLKTGIRWAAITSLVMALFITLQLQPVFLGFAAFIGINPGVLFVLLQLSATFLAMLYTSFIGRTWWKLLEDFVRNNPRLHRKGYRKDFFVYLGIGTAINLALTAIPIGLFLFYYLFGVVSPSHIIVTQFFGATPLGFALAALSIFMIAISFYIFTSKSRYGGNTKLVIESPANNYIIDGETWRINKNGKNGNARTLVERRFRFTDNLIVKTSDPECFPVYSASESGRFKHRFIFLDPEKYQVVPGFEGDDDIVRFDSIGHFMNRFSSIFKPEQRLEVTKRYDTAVKKYTYARPANAEGIKSSSAGSLELQTAIESIAHDGPSVDIVGMDSRNQPVRRSNMVLPEIILSMAKSNAPGIASAPPLKGLQLSQIPPSQVRITGHTELAIRSAA